MPTPDQQEMSKAIAHAVQRAVEAALAAVQEQKRKRGQQRKKKPTPPSDVERQIAKAANDSTAPRERHGFRGTPPPADFSLADLREDSLLTEYEVAAFTRLSTNTLAAWRKRKRDQPIEWTTIGGGRCIRYSVAAVKQFLASGRRPRPGRPRKKNAAPAAAAAAPSRKPRDRKPKSARRSSRRRADNQPEAASVP
jgi:hypothetical protein